MKSVISGVTTIITKRIVRKIRNESQSRNHRRTGTGSGSVSRHLEALPKVPPTGLERYFQF